MPAKLVRFGLFELNTATRHLLKQGRRVRLQEQPLRLLEILLEEPGRLVTRQELRQRLWPSDIYVDFDLGLTGAMKRLRSALGDSADNPRFIETVPKSGYRFLAPVQAITEPWTEQGVISYSQGMPNGAAVQTAAEPAPAGRSGYWRGVAAVAAVLVLAVSGYVLRPVQPMPQVTRIAKLSNNGHAWWQESLLTDGARLFYTEFTTEHGFRVREILLNGNEDTVLTGMPASSLIRALTPDHTTFLAISANAAQQGKPSPVYTVPVVGGPARRLGNLETNDFAWSPSGNLLAFTREGRLLLVNADGSDERELALLPGDVFYPRWSPDGRRLRCTVKDARGQTTIWEIAVDTSKAHALEFNWPGSPAEGYGEWSPDGRYFVFSSRREGISNLWAIDDNPGWVHRRRREPVQLTAGPNNYYRPLPSRDGTRLFAVGTEAAGELVRYDYGKKDFVEYMGGRSADQLDFTGDGQWVAYVAFPEGTLWRANSDGNEQVQLTFPPMRVTDPRWSPDGKRILFVARMPGKLPQICTISPEGGNPVPLVSEPHAQTSPSWSPDGSYIVYGRDPDGENQDIALYRVSADGGRSEKIPGTDGLYAPMWSPNGRHLAVQAGPEPHQLLLLDL